MATAYEQLMKEARKNATEQRAVSSGSGIDKKKVAGLKEELNQERTKSKRLKAENERLKDEVEELKKRLHRATKASAGGGKQSRPLTYQEKLRAAATMQSTGAIQRHSGDTRPARTPPTTVSPSTSIKRPIQKQRSGLGLKAPNGKDRKGVQKAMEARAMLPTAMVKRDRRSVAQAQEDLDRKMKKRRLEDEKKGRSAKKKFESHTMASEFSDYDSGDDDFIDDSKRFVCTQEDIDAEEEASRVAGEREDLEDMKMERERIRKKKAKKSRS